MTQPCDSVDWLADHRRQTPASPSGKDRITAVMPAYNSSETIAAALQSVVAQTRLVQEIVVIDDASRDATAQIAAAFKPVADPLAKAPRYRIIQQPANRGPAAARNRGLAEAQGEWIAFLDADDEWLPERLELQLQAASRHPEVALWCGRTVALEERPGGRGQRPAARGQRSESRGEDSGFRIQGSGFRNQKSESSIQNPAARISPTLTPAEGHPGSDITFLPLEEFAVRNPVATSTVLVRRQAALEAGGFDESFRGPEDYDLWLRIAARYPVARVESPLARYRLVPGSLSQDDRTFLPQVLRVLAKAYGKGGALAALGRFRSAALMYQYNHASWMAFCRGARLLAARYLWRSQRAAWRSARQTGRGAPDPFLPLLIRYLIGRRPDAAV
jgi:glycosyltransferase involved in cell wall biosynthesis